MSRNVINGSFEAVTQEQAEYSLNQFWLEHFERRAKAAKTKRELAFWEKKIETLQFQGVTEATKCH